MGKFKPELNFDYSLDLGPFLKVYPFIIGSNGNADNSNEFRAQQVQLATLCYEGVSMGRDVIVEGPTGLGKTRALLAAVLPFLQEREENRVIYSTRTVTQVKGVMKDIGKVLSSNEEFSDIDISYYIGFSRISGEFCEVSCEDCTPQLRYDKHQKNNILGMQVLKADDFVAVKEKGKCPISLMKEKSSKSKIVVCTSRYLSSNEWRDTILEGNEENTVLIIDEAHNFLGDVLNVPFLTSNQELGGHYVWRDEFNSALLLDDLGKFNKPLFEEGIKESVRYFSKKHDYLSEVIKARIRNTPIKLSDESLEEKLLSEYDNLILWESIFDDFSSKTSMSISDLWDELNDCMHSLEFRLQLEKSQWGAKAKRDMFSLLDLLDTLSRVEFNPYNFATAISADNFSVLSLNPAEVVDTINGKFKSKIYSSATISPVEDVAYTMGLDNPLTVKIEPVFPSENYCTFIVSGINSSSIKNVKETKKFAERERGILRDVFFTAIGAARGKNVGIFCSSNDAVMEVYQELEKLRGALKFNLIAHAVGKDKKFSFREDTNKLARLIGSGEAITTLDDKIELFRKAGEIDETNILLGVEGGSLSEGIDYKGKEMEMVICVGLPYQNASSQENINKIRSDYFYFKKGDREMGNDLAYRHDALRKAAQSLGRAHRTKIDKAVLILMDERVLGIKNSKTEDPKDYEYLNLLNAKKNRALLPAAFTHVGKFTEDGQTNSYVVFPNETYDCGMIDVVRQGIHAEKGNNCFINIKDMKSKIKSFYK